MIVKAHSAHPGTSEIVAQVICNSVRECGLPAGTFAVLFGSGAQVGAALVEHPAVKAVGFTGSLSAGKSLMDIAAARPEPISCFMEMSSTNPVYVLPEALHTQRSDREWLVRIVYVGCWAILHQAWFSLPARRRIRGHAGG